MLVFPLLRLGSSGPGVQNWQRFLSDALSEQLSTDGAFGPKTDRATRVWQHANGLSADGVVGAASRVLAQKSGYVPFFPAKNFTPTTGRTIDLIVFHDMEYPETPEGAEWCAGFFAGSNAPRASAHYCLAPETRVLRADLQWVPIDSLVVGDELAATEELAPNRGGRSMQLAKVERLSRREADCIRIYTSDQREVVCSTDHRWLGRQPEHQGGSGWVWLDAAWLKEGSALCAPLPVWSRRDDRIAGYVEGILDGEGCWNQAGEVTFSQKEGPVLEHTLSILREFGVPFRTHHRKESGVTIVSLSGLAATLRVLGEVGSRRLAAKQRWVGRALRSRTYDNSIFVAEVEPVGRRDVVSIQTSTRTFFAEGIVSHNCIDSNSIVQSVRDSDVAWHAPGANNNGIGIEHAGYAKQSRADWLDDYSRAELALSAHLVSKLCATYGIPLQWLDAKALKVRGTRGITGHSDVSQAFGGTHWDPGPNFPIDVYMALITGGTA